MGEESGGWEGRVRGRGGVGRMEDNWVMKRRIGGRGWEMVCVCVVVRRNEDVDPGRKGGGGRDSEGEWDDRCTISYHHSILLLFSPSTTFSLASSVVGRGSHSLGVPSPSLENQRAFVSPSSPLCIDTVFTTCDPNGRPPTPVHCNRVM